MPVFHLLDEIIIRRAGDDAVELRTIVIDEEISFASVLETTMHGRVLGTSAPRAGSKLTQTKEPFTTKAIPLYPCEQILD